MNFSIHPRLKAVVLCVADKIPVEKRPNLLFNKAMSQKGLISLTFLFLIAVLTLMVTYTLRQQTRLTSQASFVPQNYYGIVRKNDHSDCSSGLHLVNLEEDTVAHCLVAPPRKELEQFLNTPVRIFGEIRLVARQRYLLVKEIETTNINPVDSLREQILKVMGSFIQRVTR